MILLSALVFAVEPTAPTATPMAAAAAAVDPSAIVGPPNGAPLSGQALKDETHRVAKLLRCPVCQGLSVADSQSESALAMKKEVQDLVARGYDADQVLDYFEASYGEFIRFEPKFQGINLLLWGAPGALVLAGLAGVAWSVRKRPPAKPRSTSTDPDSDVDPTLLPYLRRVREETR